MQSVSIWRSFHRNEKGVVAIFFAIASLPLLFVTALAIEYTYGHNIAVKMRAAADSAVLAALSPGVYNPKNNAKDQQKISSDVALSTFKSMVPPEVTVRSVDLTTKIDTNGIRADFTYSANVDLNLLVSVNPANPATRGANFSSGNLSGSASAMVGAGAVKENTDFFIFVDMSQSMATGVDEATRTQMKNDPEMGNCQFACHYGTSNGMTASTIDVARRKGYKLRIDAVKEALLANVQNVMDIAKTSDKQLKIAITGFDTRKFELQTLTSDINLLKAAINKIDVQKDGGGAIWRWNVRGDFANNYNGLVTPNSKRSSLVISDGVLNSTYIQPLGPNNFSYIVAPTYNGDDWVPDPCFNEAWVPSTTPYDVPKSGEGYKVPFSDPVMYTNYFKGSAYHFPCTPDPRVWSNWLYDRNSIVHMGHPTEAIREVRYSEDCPRYTDPYRPLTTYSLYLEYPAPPDYSRTNLLDPNRNNWRDIFVNQYVLPHVKDGMASCASAPENALVAKDGAEMTAAFANIFGRFVVQSSAPRLVQ